MPVESLGRSQTRLPAVLLHQFVCGLLGQARSEPATTTEQEASGAGTDLAALLFVNDPQGRDVIDLVQVGQACQWVRWLHDQDLEFELDAAQSHAVRPWSRLPSWALDPKLLF